MIDCLLIGFNDYGFSEYVNLVRSMGSDSGAYHDVRLAFVEHEGRYMRALDLLTDLHQEWEGSKPGTYFHNADFLWPVIQYLGTYLHRHGFTFDYVNLFQQDRERIREKLATGQIRSVAITTTLYVAPSPILEIISFVRGCSPDVKIIVGGPYIANQAATMDRGELSGLLEYLGADIYVIGSEGEIELGDVMAVLRQSSDPAALALVPNLAYLHNGLVRFTPEKVQSSELKENLVDYGLFRQADIGQFVATRTAKSCPFSCAFCGFPQRAGKYTYLGIEDVARELDHIQEIGTVTTLTFIDDTFNVPKNRFRTILELMIERQYTFKWNSFFRSDYGDEETIHLMREAGCEAVFLGIESGSDEMLELMNKRSRRRHYLPALKAFRETGISAYASFIVGFPGETRETAAQTVDLIEEGRPEYYRTQLWYCDPRTPVWDRREELGIQGEAFTWSHNTMDWRTATGIITDIFTSVRNSTWMPQLGFEQWSTMYLQRRGMKREEVRSYVQAFNAAVKDQLEHPDRKTIPPHLLAPLRAASRFTADAGADRAAAGTEPTGR
jgi:anaerobic magnesium-protoporphyrin IX monomethyl ester cyclase